MTKKIISGIFCLSLGFNLACQSGSAPTEGNGTAANKAPMTNGQMPEGISASPLPMTGTTPGIPDPKNANINAVPKGATPTPGIPDPKEASKPFKPGATPTPGIPDPETLKKQMSTNSNFNVNAVPANPPATNIKGNKQ